MCCSLGQKGVREAAWHLDIQQVCWYIFALIKIHEHIMLLLQNNMVLNDLWRSQLYKDWFLLAPATNSSEDILKYTG